MKPAIVLARIILIGILWSIFFVEGIRVIMLTNWRFDIFQTAHWVYAWNLWYSGAWVINDAKEWAFVLIIVSFIPLWLTGWAALSIIQWEKIIVKASLVPIKIFNRIFKKQVQKIKNTASIKAVNKKKSYKEIRPRSLRNPIDERPASPMPSSKLTSSSTKPSAQRYAPKPTPASAAAPAENKSFEHSLFKFGDEEEDFEFNFDAFDTSPSEDKKESKPAPKENTRKDRDTRDNRDSRKDNRKDNKKNSRSDKSDRDSQPAKPTGNSTLDVLTQKGYEVITGATIKNNLIDFIGVSNSKICICLVDKEAGDWLADEERFNDEEPLWFSESSHRISPVRKADIARDAVRDKISEVEGSFEVKVYVIEQIGNIINAEDMFEIWNDMDISVTRIDRGSPKELKLFSRTLDETIEPISKEKFEKIKKAIRNIN